MRYPDDLTGMKFGKLVVLWRAKGYENENKMWRCKCFCGRPNCKGIVVLRRGNLTRKTDWELTCGAAGNNAVQSAKTKLETGVVQRNSKTGIAGVNHSCDYEGRFRARICFRKNRLTKDNLSFEEAVAMRTAWEMMVKYIGDFAT